MNKEKKKKKKRRSLRKTKSQSKCFTILPVKLPTFLAFYTETRIKIIRTKTFTQNQQRRLYDSNCLIAINFVGIGIVSCTRTTAVTITTTTNNKEEDVDDDNNDDDVSRQYRYLPINKISLGHVRLIYLDFFFCACINVERLVLRGSYAFEGTLKSQK